MPMDKKYIAYTSLTPSKIVYAQNYKVAVMKYACAENVNPEDVMIFQGDTLHEVHGVIA
jgi:hypothetical protein